MDDMFLGTPNRVSRAIEKTKKQLEERVNSGVLSKAQLDKHHETASLDIEEYCRFQELKSLAMMEGKLTETEAQLIYHYLGNEPSHFNNQPIEVKIVLIKIYSELLTFRIKQRV